MYYSYILKSLKDWRYYYGQAKDLEKRLIRHNSGKVRSTKSRRPFEIHYFDHLKQNLRPTKESCFLNQ